MVSKMKVIIITLLCYIPLLKPLMQEISYPYPSSVISFTIEDTKSPNLENSSFENVLSISITELFLHVIYLFA